MILKAVYKQACCSRDCHNYIYQIEREKNVFNAFLNSVLRSISPESELVPREQGQQHIFIAFPCVCVSNAPNENQPFWGTSRGLFFLPILALASFPSLTTAVPISDRLGTGQRRSTHRTDRNVLNELLDQREGKEPFGQQSHVTLQCLQPAGCSWAPGLAHPPPHAQVW